MIFQILFSLLFVCVGFYVYLQKTKSAYFFYILNFLVLTGLYLLWNPIDATRMANLIGVGRGADLLLYVWVLISFFTVICIYYKIRQLMDYLTILSRRLAILESEISQANIQK